MGSRPEHIEFLSPLRPASESPFSFGNQLSVTLKQLSVGKAMVFLGWEPTKSAVASFTSHGDLRLAPSLDEPTQSFRCLVFCGSETLIGFRRLVGWWWDGARRLVVFATPNMYSDQPIAWWIRKAALESLMRKLGRPADHLWSLMRRKRLRKLVLAIREDPRVITSPSNDLGAGVTAFAIESLGRGGAEKQVLIRAQELMKSGEGVVLIINNASQSRLQGVQSLVELRHQPSISEVFESDRFLDIGVDDTSRKLWLDLLDLLPADLWQATYLAALSLKNLRPRSVVTYLDWTNVTAGLAALLIGTPEVRMSFRNVNPSRFAFHRFEFLGIYQAVSKVKGIHFEANSYAGLYSYARWLKIADNQIDYQANFEDSEPLVLNKSRQDSLSIVGWLGRFAPEKDPLLWVGATASLCRDFPIATGVMAGQGPLCEMVQQEIGKRGLSQRITIGPVTDSPNQFLGSIRALLLTSRFEGRPNVIAEAAAAGTPVLSTDAGDARQMSEELPNVKVLRSRDPEEFARALTNMGVA